MSEYRVIRTFVDLSDKHYIYHTGDKYPRDGGILNENRIAELTSVNNKTGMPVIEKVMQDKKKMPYEKPMIIEVPAAETVGDPDKKPAEQTKKRGRKKKNAE